MLSRFFSSFTDTCSLQEHVFVRYKVPEGGDCTSFCQCAPLRTNVDGSKDYYWQRMPCPSDTLYDINNNVCDHSINVQCTVGKSYSVLSRKKQIMSS